MLLNFIITITILIIIILIIKDKFKKKKSHALKLSKDIEYSPEVEELIKSTMSIGEQLLAICDFIKDGENVTAVVTNKNLHIYRIQWDSKREINRLISDIAIGIKQISGLGIQDGEPTEYRPYSVCISFWWDGGKESIETIYKQGYKFIEELKRIISYRDAEKTGTSIGDELEKLAQLAKDGVLSEDEWSRAKEMYLGKPADKRETAIETLRKLFDLHNSGVLSKSEFNTKKWEILSKNDIS